MDFRRIAMAGNLAVVSLLSGAAMGQVNPQTDDSIAKVELREIKVLSSKVPLKNAQTPLQVSVITKDDIKNLPVNTIDDLLKFAVGVDVRTRGNAVQNDISMRGGTFDQVTILLNGINISCPQTGHHSFDFPLSTDDIERIEILEGPSARVFGTSAFVGTVNVVTKGQDATTNGVDGLVNLFAGDNGYTGLNANVSIAHSAGYGSDNNVARLVHNISGGYVHDDGDTPNSGYDISRVYYHAGYRAKGIKGDFQAGYSYKPYQANTFYGAASTDQWESNEHFIIAANGDIQLGKVHVNPSFSADRRYDHYQWHRNNPAGENFHRCDVRTAGMTVWAENKIGRTSFTAEMRNELIYSTKLGELMQESEFFDTKGHDATNGMQYNHFADRTNICIMAEHDILLPKWTIALAVPAITNTDLDHKWRFCPGTDISFRPSQNWKYFVNVNSALRMPTFTDLYYSGVNIQGTTDLKPERTIDYSVGTKLRYSGLMSEIRIYGSHKKDMIDWVIYADDIDETTYKSGNFEMDNCGFEVMTAFLASEIWETNPICKIQVQYAFNNVDIQHTRPIVASKYAMEYLKHKVVVTTDIRIIENLSLSGSYRYQYRTGEGNNPYSLVDLGIKYDLKKFSFYVNSTNLFDKEYYDFSYIIQSGRRFFAGMKFEF